MVRFVVDFLEIGDAASVKIADVELRRTDLNNSFKKMLKRMQPSPMKLVKLPPRPEDLKDNYRVIWDEAFQGSDVPMPPPLISSRRT